ncbi:uncharacterized protein PFL1_04104 [Pseudozyma flocculosa PF-1]|uniref:RRM domain-containing protein n=2 Tax=Pseudozyma flocculosa TaxID=84751 RepID=A0A5C3EU80_9BASI|nr:uncharacterized protein PFL1_04104 [Pseudozyma flocculosa PF-1]EPQ28277.1 hypothetical protein PFL1_04104 [Pseudozyma flocculosa PF-1]SPO35420.1 uncharacterized protein PSFLO_00891 [Pseudozyma flocculosa]
MSVPAASSTSITPEMASGSLHHAAAAQPGTPRPYLYVGNLSPRVTDTMLHEIFSVAGPVQSVKIIPDRSFTQGGLSYGFVEYVDMRSAEAAVQTLDGRNIFDSEITVKWAKQSHHPSLQSAEHSEREEGTGNYHVFVGDLSQDVTDAVLRQAFSGFPSLADVRVMFDMVTGKSRGYGFVSFTTKADAEQSIATMNGEWLAGRAIRLNWAHAKSQGGIRVSSAATNTTTHPVIFGTAGMGMGMAMPMAGGIGMAMPNGRQAMLGMPGMAGPMIRMAPGVAMPIQAFSPAVLGNVTTTTNGNGHGTLHINGGAIALQQQQQLGQPLSYEQVLAATPPNVTTVYLGNLAPFTTQNDLMTLMAPFGFVIEVRIQADRGYAFVKLDSHEHAANAVYSLGANGCSVHGRPVKVSWGKERNESASNTAVIAANAAIGGSVNGQNGGYGNMGYGVQPAAQSYGFNAVNNNTTGSNHAHGSAFPQPTLPNMTG